MKFGIRIPSLRKRIAARTSPARFIRHSLGFKAPRGWGWLTNPKKAAYNRVYNRTTIGCLVPLLLAFLLVVFAASWASAEARDAKLYDSSGRYQGKVTSDGQGQAKRYDKSGRYQGKAVRQGKTVKLYDKSGRYLGRVNTR